MYSVFDPTGKKIADCGSLRDATNLVGMRGEGHYYQYKPVYQTVDIKPAQDQLPTTDNVVNMDGGVGGSWFEVAGQTLQMQQSELPEVDL